MQGACLRFSVTFRLDYFNEAVQIPEISLLLFTEFLLPPYAWPFHILNGVFPVFVIKYNLPIKICSFECKSLSLGKRSLTATRTIKKQNCSPLPQISHVPSQWQKSCLSQKSHFTAPLETDSTPSQWWLVPAAYLSRLPLCGWTQLICLFPARKSGLMPTCDDC